MSAFICTPDHIKAIAIFAAAEPRDSETISDSWLRHQLQEYGLIGEAPIFIGDSKAKAELIAAILYAENIRSVSCRYRELPTYKDGVSTDDLPGLIERPQIIHISDREMFHQPVRNPVHILKMCDCLEYQSCETSDYRKSLAFALLEVIRKGAIRRLPGYDEAPWEYQAA